MEILSTLRKETTETLNNMKYRKKPVVIEAIQWTGKNTSEINTKSRDEVLKEGWPFGESPRDENPANAFARLWNSINAKRGFGWEVNPWVWRIEFKRCSKEVDGE